MTFRNLLLTLIYGISFLISPALQADTLSINDINQTNPVKADVDQPYVVKKGDTLWDIAEHFFKNPHHWIKVWEHNLYITNPDLIYPGNRIWFDGKRLQQGGLSTVKPIPKIIIKAVERLEIKADNAVLLTALTRQDFIQAKASKGIGHVLDSLDERLNFGANDRVYLQLDEAAEVGTLFDVFRNTDVIRDPKSNEATGILVEHLGQIRITSSGNNGIYRGLIVKAFEEISRGDKLKQTHAFDPYITPIESENSLTGNIIYIRNHAHEAAQNHIIGINIGLKQGLKAGTTMSILRSGRIITDKTNDEQVLLPTEKIGELIVLVPQQRASIALITSSTAPIHIGDSLLSTAP